MDIEEFKSILGEINKISLNFGKCSKVNKTVKYRESRLQKLSELRGKYKTIYARLLPFVNENESINQLYAEVTECHKRTVEQIENCAISSFFSVESEFAHLTETVLAHLRDNFGTDDFNRIQLLVDSYESIDQTGAELYRNLLDNLLKYHARQEDSLRQENRTLLSKISAQKELTTQLVLESEVSHTETQNQEKLIEEFKEERSKLYKKIRKLEEERFEIVPNLDRSLTEKDKELLQKDRQISALQELLKETQEIHNKSIAALRLENNRLQRLIVKIKLEKLTNMADSLQEISKQVNSVIPTFSGEKNGHLITELNIFINTCQILFDSLTQAGQAVFLKYISTRCRGDAYDLVTRRKFTTLKEFFKILTDSYLPLKSVRDFKEELHRCCQRPGESLTEYGDRLKRVLWDCIKCIETKYSDNNSAFIKEIEIEAIDVFRAGINNLSVRHYLLTIKTENLEEVIKEAIYFERVDNRYKKIEEKFMPTHTVAQIDYQFNNNLQPQVVYPHQQFGNHYVNNSPQQYEPRFGLPPQAHVMGHQNQQYMGQERQFIHSTYRTPNNYNFRGNNAPLRYNNQEVNRNFGQVQQFNQGMVSCHYCGKRGHILNDCRRRLDVCFRCGQTGHYQMNCNANTVGDASGLAGSCLFCGRTNHTVAECVFKKQWEETSGANSQSQGN